MTVTLHKEFEKSAVDAGINQALAHLMYNARRDAIEHGWPEDLRDWFGENDGGKKVIEKALSAPDRMELVCGYLLAIDGGLYEEGAKLHGYTVEQEIDVETLLWDSWEAELD